MKGLFYGAIGLILGISNLAFASNKHVILISVDALTPAIYLNKQYQKDIPNIMWLIGQGSYAQKLNPVTPLFSFPNHVSITTGVNPLQHGIKSNVNPKTKRLFIDARNIQVPTLWNSAVNANLRTAAINWPLTYAEKVTYLIPQNLDGNIPSVITDFPASGKQLEDFLTKSSTPGLYQGLKQRLKISTPAQPLNNKPENANQLNQLTAGFTSEIIQLYKPNLVLTHFVDRDSPYFNNQQDTTQTLSALKAIDQYIGMIIQAVGKAGISKDTTYIILGTKHIGTDAKQQINPTALVLEAIGNQPGSARIISALTTNIVRMDQTVILPSRNTTLEASQRQLQLLVNAVQQKYSNMITIGSKQDSDVRDLSDRKILTYLNTKAGYVFSMRNNAIVSPHLDQTPGIVYSGGFIMSGAGVQRNVVLPEVETLSIAATVSQLLGIRMLTSMGKPISAMLISAPQPSPAPQQIQTKPVQPNSKQ